MNAIELKDFSKEYEHLGPYHYQVKGFKDWFLTWNYWLLVRGLPHDHTHILDLASGDGRLEFIHKKFNIIGLDLCPKALGFARDKVCRENFIAGDMRELPFKGNIFDAVISSLSVQYLNESDLRKVLRDIKRALKPGGTFAFSYINPNNYVNTRYAEKLLKEHKPVIPVLERARIELVLSEEGFNVSRVVGTNIPVNYQKIPSWMGRFVFELSKAGYFLPDISYHMVYYAKRKG